MIYLLILNHEVKYDLIELLKVFFPGREITLIYDEEDYPGEGILIVSSLYHKDNNPKVISKLYIDNKFIEESIEDINLVKIYREFKNKIKIAIKKSIYNMLINNTEIKVPWGILTGIRPVKICHDLLDKNINEDEIFNVLTEEYKLSNYKAKLILDISKTQRKYINAISSNSFSLYVGIPFCPSRCLYCSFPSLPVSKYENYIEEYVSKVIYEIESIGDLMEGNIINTVYIGGGTPTAIPYKHLEKIILAIYDRFGKENIKEFTVEAGRPDTITKDYLNMLKKTEIGRISINPQTMNNNTLKLIGRKHKSEDIINTYNMARDIGFDVINMDLIMGLPNEELNDVINTLKEIIKMDPENLTVHTLSVKKGSIFKESIYKYTMKSQDEVSSMLNEALKASEKMGMIPYYLYRQKQILGNYENIGYSKKGKECIYNILMMEEKETIIATGMGSVSKIYFPDENRIERVPNFKDLNQYITRINELINNKKRILKI